MTKEKNEQIGKVVCPWKGCEEVCAVFRYRERAVNPARRRHAGKLYASCPKHGRFEDQEHILAGEIWGAKKPEGDDQSATDPAPVAPDKPAPVAPAKTPEIPAPAPMPKAPEQPVPAPEKKRTTGWGWFQ